MGEKSPTINWRICLYNISGREKGHFQHFLVHKRVCVCQKFHFRWKNVPEILDLGKTKPSLVFLVGRFNILVDLRVLCTLTDLSKPSDIYAAIYYYKMYRRLNKHIVQNVIWLKLN